MKKDLQSIHSSFMTIASSYSLLLKADLARFPGNGCVDDFKTERLVDP